MGWIRKVKDIGFKVINLQALRLVLFALTYRKYSAVVDEQKELRFVIGKLEE